MSDWAVGDLAVCIGHDGRGWAEKFPPGKGAILPVDGVVDGGTWVALIFNGNPSSHWTQGWSHRSFRKILPDKHEACESEFVDLLKRSKVPTETIVTVDRDGRAYLRDAA